MFQWCINMISQSLHKYAVFFMIAWLCRGTSFCSQVYGDISFAFAWCIWSWENFQLRYCVLLMQIFFSFLSDYIAWIWNVNFSYSTTETRKAFNISSVIADHPILNSVKLTSEANETFTTVLELMKSGCVLPGALANFITL